MTNAQNPSRCPVQAPLRIRARAICLGVPPHLPIALFQNSTGSSQYIDDFHVTHTLPSLATQVYNVKNQNDLEGLLLIHLGLVLVFFSMKQVKHLIS